MEKWDAVVVGAGVGGLACAAYLAKAGKRLLVLESRNNVGGRATSVSLAGILGELGMHGLSAGGHTARLLPALGKDVPMVMLEPNLVVFHDNRFFEVPGRTKEFANFDYVPEAHRAELVDILTLIENMPIEETEEWDSISWGDWMREHTSQREILDLLEFFGNLIVTEEFNSNIAAGEALRCTRLMLKEGGWAIYPEDGAFKAISDALAEVVNENGQVRCGVRVREILVKDNVTRGVLAEGPEGLLSVEAPIVISNLPVWEITSLLSPDRFPRWFVDRIRFLEQHSQVAPRSSVGFSCVSSEPIHNYKTAVVLPGASPLNTTGPSYWRWLCAPTNWAPRLSRDGRHLFQYGAIWPRYYVDLLRERPALLAKDLDGLYREVLQLFPSFDPSSIVWRGTGVLLSTDLSMKFPGNAWKQRIDVRAPNASGLYFVGDTVRGWGIGVDGAVHSAIRCAKKILKKKVLVG